MHLPPWQIVKVIPRGEARFIHPSSSFIKEPEESVTKEEGKGEVVTTAEFNRKHKF